MVDKQLVEKKLSLMDDYCENLKRLDIFSQFASEIRHWLKKRKKG